jgi:hypothetical protein
LLEQLRKRLEFNEQFLKSTMATPRKTPRKAAPFDAEKEHRRASTVPGEEGIQG